MAFLGRRQSTLLEAGFTSGKRFGDNLPSGPDFLRFDHAERAILLEIQTAKTDFQRTLVQRAVAVRGGEVRVATAEDLIVLKLIANRPQDQIDLLGLVEIEDLDWEYIERAATEWDVLATLRELRAR
ncbi:MAG: DUF6036 family nucleotidyltransferase [Deltaproteobacteria bacterium]